MVERRWCSPQSLLGVQVLSLLMQSRRMLVSAQGVPYDCKAGFDSWWIGWSDSKKDYCCRHEQRGCQYDCKAALKNWQAAWSEEKKQWCCRFEQLGCGARAPTTHTWTTTSNRGAAATGVEHLSAASGLDWIKPFGFHEDLPTQTMTTTKTTTIVMQTTTSTHTTTTTSYDCADGIAYYHENWSAEKSEYCCTKHDKGCRIDSCTVGLRSMRSAWSANKTVRCCGRWLEQGRWPPFTKTQCCRSTSIGCPATQTTSTPVKFVPAAFVFDCDVGYKNWEDEWSVGKQAYCCLHRSRGCSPKAATTTELEITTTTELQTIMTTTALKFDCSAGVDNWEHGWSTFKQDYCCKTQGFPCRLEGNNTKTKDTKSELGEGTNTVADLMHEGYDVRRAKSTEIAVSDTEPYDCAVEHYDCTEDIATWRTTWGVAKRRWCCVHDRKWCPTNGSANTTSAVSTPNSLTAPSWSKTKRDWCCKHKQKGCASKDHKRLLARALDGVGVKVDQLRSEQQQLTSSTDTRRMWTASLLGLAAGGVALSLGLAGRARLRALTHRDIGLLPMGEEPEE